MNCDVKIKWFREKKQLEIFQNILQKYDKLLEISRVKCFLYLLILVTLKKNLHMFVKKKYVSRTKNFLWKITI